MVGCSVPRNWIYYNNSVLMYFANADAAAVLNRLSGLEKEKLIVFGACYQPLVDYEQLFKISDFQYFVNLLSRTTDDDRAAFALGVFTQ